MNTRRVGALLLGLMVCATIALAFVFEDRRRDADGDRRAEQAALVTEQIRGTLAGAAGALGAVRGLLDSGRIDAGQFSRFTDPVLRSQPALDSLSFAPRVGPERRARFERRLGLRIDARGGADAFPVTYVAGPGAGPDRAGADLMSDPVHARALRRARDSGRPQASMPVSLPGDGGPGLVVSVPVYARGHRLATTQGRREALRGFASGVFRVAGLASVVRLPPGTALEVAEDGRTIVGSVRDDEAATIHVAYAGRRWSIRLGSMGATSMPVAAAIVLGAGLGLTLATALLLLAYHRREGYAQRLVARRLAERDEAEDRFRLLAERSSDMITRSAPDGRLLYVSPACRTLLGHEPAELVDRTPLTLVHPDDADAMRGALARVRSQDRAVAVSVRMRCAGGGYAWVEAVMHAIRDPESGRLQELHAVTRDVSERKHVEARLRELADHDELTGARNRRSFNRELERELAAAARAESAGALLMVDLDDFKAINDAHGHAAGDRLLVEVARTLGEGLRTTDVVARLGGDEFAVLLPGADAERAREVGERVTGALHELAGHRIAASVGITSYGAGSALRHPAEVLAQADMALYAAKRSGGDRVAEAYVGAVA